MVGRRRLLATGGLGLWLEMGVSVWRSLRHIGSAFEALQPHVLFMHELTWVIGCTLLILPFDVVSGPFGNNAHAN